MVLSDRPNFYGLQLIKSHSVRLVRELQSSDCVQLVTIMTMPCQLKGKNNDLGKWVAGINCFLILFFFFFTQTFKHLLLSLVKEY